MKQKKKILFVAMQMSTHTARWINQISEQDFDVHLFPVNHLPLNTELRNVTVHQPWHIFRPRLFVKNLLRRTNETIKEHHPSVQTKPIYPIRVLRPILPYLNGMKSVSLGESEARAPAVYGPRVLRKLIRELKPDLIHSLEFQHCGYKVLRTKEMMQGDFPPWLATNWGSDIYYYQRFAEHRSQISRMLRNADYYSCECERDIQLAKDLGFSGTVMPVMPNGGGFDIQRMNQLRNFNKPTNRKIIMVKGYEHFAGRALMALEALEMCADDLRDFKIIVFSPSKKIHKRITELQLLGLDINLLHGATHDFMLRLFSRARIYLGVSISDAISTSMLEAMAAGAFPIQTNTSCCYEWIKDNESGFIIPPDDVYVIADRLKTALKDDALINRAFELNWQTVQSRLDHLMLKEETTRFYNSIFSKQ